MSISVVIPSRSIANLAASVRSVIDLDPLSKIIVVDDGVDWIPEIRARVSVVEGVKPFVFSRNSNLGIKAAPAADNIVLMNDDALLKTPWGFHDLEELADRHPELGLISPVTNVTGQPSQLPQNVGLRYEPRTVAFICVFIPRATIGRIGLLDERFVGYGYEDNDYCRRVSAAGLRIGIFDDCFVDHGSLTPTFRESARAPGDCALGRQIYEKKYGAGAR